MASCIQKWGLNNADVKRADRLLAILMMFIEEMRPHTPQRKAMHPLHEKLIDSEVLVNIPPSWLSEEAKEKVDDHVGEGTHDSLSFDPNNAERIRLSWRKAEVKPMLARVIVECKKKMDNHTKGIVGGNGDAIARSMWENQGELECVACTKVKCNIICQLCTHWTSSFMGLSP